MTILEEKLAAPVVRINVCSGRHVLPDYINVDAVVSTHPKAKGRVPEVLSDAKSIPLPSACADELLCVHGFEHFYRFEVDGLIEEWKRLLKPGGTLILEMPDVIKCCENLLQGFTLPGKHPDQFTMWGLYGDPTGNDPFMAHRWGWHPKSLRKFLEQHGFINIRDEAPLWHAAGAVRRDMRMTARKQ